MVIMVLESMPAGLQREERGGEGERGERRREGGGGREGERERGERERE